MKNYVLPLAIAIVGAVTISVLVVAKPEPTPRPPADAPANVQVNVVAANPGMDQLAVVAQGTVTPKREIDLVAQVSGQILSVMPNFVDGGFFDSSELLIQVDDRDYQAAVLQAESRVAEAEQRLAQEQGLSRQAKREWHDLGDPTANDLFMRKPQLAAASAALASAQGDLDIAKLNLERTRITVPFAGRVKETHVNIGQFVSSGVRLATVYDSSVVEVRVPLTEQQAALINLPFTNSVSQDQLTEVRVEGVVAGVEHQWQGHLVRTDAFVDTQTRMYNAVVEVEQPFAETVPLLPGLFVEVFIDGKALQQVTKLPRSALYKRNLLIVLDQENKVVELPVKVLRKTADYIWVQGDIESEALVSIEKQSLTPAGTVIDPQMEMLDEKHSSPAQVAIASQNASKAEAEK